MVLHCLANRVIPLCSMFAKLFRIAILRYQILLRKMCSRFRMIDNECDRTPLLSVSFSTLLALLNAGWVGLEWLLMFLKR